jgi:hypothetical protein
VEGEASKIEPMDLDDYMIDGIKNGGTENATQESSAQGFDSDMF